ncbi:MAG TPA: dihydrolipoamide acetyltransferase family protein [Candidatus Dormibacteraeota bacterium]|jgi:2-oxoisovalerate dehydrogenase E2 component (dihydrolipoyl transacylase)|nr:dihydrolipoamide acetyltransferase family protein [Candidatus Dormibacteraeota bacterium]
MGVVVIKMPQLGESVTEGTVERWLKREGDYVRRDEPLVEVVTDKVNAEIPSPYEGRLTRISVQEGTTIPIGQELALIEVAGEEAGVAAGAPAVETTPSAPAAPPAAAPATVSAPEPVAPGPRRLSPAVRRLVEEHGLDPGQIPGTGEGGRVTRDDVLAFLAQREPAAAPTAPPSPAPAAAEELVRPTTMRRSIAEHMVRSLATAPHAWTLQEVDVSELVRYREAEKEGFRRRHGVPLTYVPFVAQVLCEALAEFPYLNSSWTEEGILLKRYVNLGVAVAVPDGLIVPVVKDAARMGFAELARAIADLVERARAGRLTPEEVRGGTFTLNNTGATGSIASQPIINQPQAAILTMEAITRRPVVVGEGIAIRHMMNMCLSFDHRIVDGMMAGSFLGFIKQRLEGWTPASIRI